MADFVRDPSHWLFKMSPSEWIRTGLVEIRRAEQLYAERNAKGALASARRAAGMGINGALIVQPNPDYGRTYVEHIQALERDDTAPAAVRAACRVLLETQPPNPSLISLRSAKSDERVLEAARDVMAHAYAIIKRSEPFAVGEA